MVYALIKGKYIQGGKKMKTKKEGYKTAQVLISSGGFVKGEFVSVKYYWTDENNTDWYLIGLHGNVVLPSHHLTRFTF